MGGMGEKVWSACEKFEDEGGILGNVSDSSVAGSSGLSRIKGR